MKKKLFCGLFILNLIALFAESPRDFIKRRCAELFPEAVRIRRELHQIPEPCLNEYKTAQFIVSYLQQFGLEIKTGIAKTGIRAVLRGAKPGPVVAIRADMDALPLEEKTGLMFTSRHSGMMHACGHDAHMTNLLIAARILSEMRTQISGTIVFIFQPCEEGSPSGISGAHLMIKEGILENPRVDAIIGLHVLPDFPAGTVALRSGALMANVAFFEIIIEGRPSHGALPQQGIDALYIACQAVIHFQGIISREKDPLQKAVLSICRIKGGTANNIIADRVELGGTVRTFSFELENFIEARMRRMLDALALGYGVKYSMHFERASQYVKNDPQLTEVISSHFRQLLGEENVLLAEPQTIAEDFSAYSHKIPAVFFFLGTGGSEKLHSPAFSVNEEILRTAPLLFVSGALELIDYLQKNRK